MAIIPLSAGIVPYPISTWPMQYTETIYPTLYFPSPRYPVPYPYGFTIPNIQTPIDPYGWSEANSSYRFINAAYNPGSFWIYSSI